MQHIIETRHLTKYYGETKVVDSLDLRVEAGCVYGFLGRNGAGKSTTIKMLLGMVQPTRGEIRLFDRPLEELPPSEKSRIAYMAEGHPLYVGMTIKAILDFQKAFYPTWNDTLAGRVLDHFELPLRKRIWSLSRGQRAQVALALAIAPEPELLILDDPTLGLDTVIRREFLESLIQIIQQKGRTILFSSHVLGDVERVADRIGIMVEGVLRVDCPTDHFKEALKKVVIEFPGAPPEIPNLKGMISQSANGNRVEVVIANFNGVHREALDALKPKHLEEIEFNLEDAFIEYTRKRGKSLVLEDL
jgi:ABC-2 type transport system ATP-binding protein